jgi:hypothetical protein
MAFFLGASMPADAERDDLEEFVPSEQTQKAPPLPKIRNNSAIHIKVKHNLYRL